MTVTVNNNSTVTISGTNDSTSTVSVINKEFWSGEYSERVYPAGTYTIPAGFTFGVRAAQYPKNVVINGATGNLSGTVTIPEPFRIVVFAYKVSGGATVDITLPLGLYYGNSVPETNREYLGILHTVTFDRAVYEGEFNWQTGELKDEQGNVIAYYDPHEITSLPGVNYFWTCFGENTISNVSNELGKVILRLNESASEETIPSICDFMLTPTTISTAAYALYHTPFMPSGELYGSEVPTLTTKGKLLIKSADNSIKYSKYIGPIFNTRGVTDTLTHKGLEKQWSEKFYLTKMPISITTVPAPYSGAIDNDVFVWEFDEDEFINTGIPAKIHDIPMATPCFSNDDRSERRISNEVIYNGTAYPAFFSYNTETKKYTLSARGLQGWSIDHQLTKYSKVYFHYQLETSYIMPYAFAMGISAGDKISFEADLVDAQPFIDNGRVYNDLANKEINIDPTITALIPRNVEDAMSGMDNAARLLNADNFNDKDNTIQSYNWIGEGDGITDYTVQIQSKLDELSSVSNGGTIYLGPGVYPITKSLIVHGNINIIGEGNTIIEQKSDNTHAIIWNGSNICMRDLTIKLSGECTELTACILSNDNNSTQGNRDDRYPENTYVQYCSVSNVTLRGTYQLSWDGTYNYLSERALNYRGVGVLFRANYSNFHDYDGLTCKNLYSGTYGSGGANNHRMYVTECRSAVRGGGGNNIFNITGHTYYGTGQSENVIATDYIYYGERSDSNNITLTFYDVQYSKGLIYFDGKSQRNRYTAYSKDSGLSTGSNPIWSNYVGVTDFGRGNKDVQPYKDYFVGVGPAIWNKSTLPVWNTHFNPSVHNALSGAGLWGSITSNIEWRSVGNIELSDICRYPKDTGKTYFGLASMVSEVSPSEESPIEIIIDISDRPVSNYLGFWIQFDHKYVAEKYTVSFDTTNDGTFNLVAFQCNENNEVISYKFNYQEPSLMVYRIKISITKAFQMPNFVYHDSGYTEYTIDYNPDGLVGIVNIGMPSNEVYGRAFLGECGGNIYGNVDMHQNTLKNLPAPVDSGDAVSKEYLEEKLTEVDLSSYALKSEIPTDEHINNLINTILGVIENGTY